MKILLTIMLTTVVILCPGQNSSQCSIIDTLPKMDTYSEVYKVVEQMPVFPGGVNALTQYFERIPCPKEAMENGITGTVFVQFIIDTSGNVTQPSVLSTSGSTVLDNAALAYLRSMPKWQPGMIRGKSVMVQLVQPVRFNLN